MWLVHYVWLKEVPGHTQHTEVVEFPKGGVNAQFLDGKAWNHAEISSGRVVDQTKPLHFMDFSERTQSCVTNVSTLSFISELV